MPIIQSKTNRTQAGPAAHLTEPLPTSAERPNVDVVIFDGQCRMCLAQMQKLAWWDGQRHLSYISLHDPLVAERYPDLSRERLLDEMVIVDRQGRRHGGAEAVRYLTRRLRRLWWAAPLLHVPGSLPLWKLLYRTIARNRYRWGKLDDCHDGTCDLHAR